MITIRVAKGYWWLGVLAVLSMCAWAQSPSGPITLTIEPKEAYIERRGAQQILNFDLLLRNVGASPLRINKIQISIYDATGVLAYRRYLDENGRPSAISTVPDRIVPAGGTLDVFNPFYSFDEQMPLDRLHYEVFFENIDTKEPNLLNFFAKAEVDVSPTRYPGKTVLHLPLRGRVYVFDGHDFYAHHRRQNVLRDNKFRPNSVRFGYDLMITNAAGELFHGDRFVPENWFAYGSTIYATAAGTVVDTANDIPDNSYKNSEVVYPDLPDSVDPIGLGNHVVIDHGNGEYSIVLHMKSGSVRVKTGDHVKQGDPIGVVGFSGDTFLPHLHYQIMDGIDERTSRGLPSYFDNFQRVLGSTRVSVKHGQIDSGDIIENSWPK